MNKYSILFIPSELNTVFLFPSEINIMYKLFQSEQEKMLWRKFYHITTLHPLPLPGFLNLQLPGVSVLSFSLELYTGIHVLMEETIGLNCWGEIHSSSGIRNNHGNI